MRVNSVSSGASVYKNGVKKIAAKGNKYFPKKGVELSSEATTCAAQLGLILGCFGSMPLGAKLKDISNTKACGFGLFVVAASVACSFAAVGIAKALKNLVVSMNDTSNEFVDYDE